MGMVNPEGHTLFFFSSGYPHISLKAVRQAIFVRKIEEIYYPFSPGTEKLFADVHDMTQLIERLIHVGKVQLHFGDFDWWAKYAGESGGSVDPVKWKRSMSTLLDKVLDKGCQELYVRGGEGILTLYPGDTVMRNGDSRRTFAPKGSPVLQPGGGVCLASPAPTPAPHPTDLPIADSIIANPRGISIQDSKLPSTSKETVTSKRRGLFSIFKKWDRKLPASVQLTTRVESLDGAGDAPPSLIEPGTRPEPVPALPSPPSPKVLLKNLDGAGDVPINIETTIRVEPASTSPESSSTQLGRQPKLSLAQVGVERDGGGVDQTRKMTRFHIHSKMLLDDPFLDWTISTIMISASTLTALSFKSSFVHTNIWRTVLHSLYLPHLQSFELMAGSLMSAVPGEDHQHLYYFLRRHPTIKILGLYGSSQAGSPFVPLPAPILPNLTDLRAHPYYITWLISPITLDPTSMPGLISITIAPGYLYTDLFRYTDFDDAIHSVAHIQRKMRLCSYFDTQPECSVDSWLHRHVNMHTPPSPIMSLHHIQDLVISSHHFSVLSARVLKFLPTWLNLFPDLRSLKFGRLPAEDRQRIEDLNFKQILADGCPKMERMYNSKGVEFNLHELRGRNRAMEDGSGGSGSGLGCMGDPIADGSS